MVSCGDGMADAVLVLRAPLQYTADGRTDFVRPGSVIIPEGASILIPYGWVGACSEWCNLVCVQLEGCLLCVANG